MNDQTNQSNPNQPVTTTQDSNMPVEPVVPVASGDSVVPPASAPSSVLQTQDDHKDLQSLSQDLQNLAQEAAQTAPVAPAAPAVPSVAPTAPVETPPAPDASTPAVAPSVLEPEKTVSEANITIYTTVNCPFCKTEKEFLTAQGLSFVEKNVEQDNAALKEMLNISDNFAGVPVTVLNGPKGKKVVKGFTQEEFVKELSETGIKEVAPLSQAVSEPKPEAVVAPAQPLTEPDAPAVEAPKVPDLQ